MIEQVFLAGVPVPDARVLELARRLADAELAATADKLETTWHRENGRPVLEPPQNRLPVGHVERQHPGFEFAELRAVLLQEHV